MAKISYKEMQKSETLDKYMGGTPLCGRCMKDMVKEDNKWICKKEGCGGY